MSTASAASTPSATTPSSVWVPVPVPVRSARRTPPSTATTTRCSSAPPTRRLSSTAPGRPEGTPEPEPAAAAAAAPEMAYASSFGDIRSAVSGVGWVDADKLSEDGGSISDDYDSEGDEEDAIAAAGNDVGWDFDEFDYGVGGSGSGTGQRVLPISKMFDSKVRGCVLVGVDALVGGWVGWEDVLVLLFLLTAVREGSLFCFTGV